MLALFVEHEHAVRRQVVIARESLARQEIVHRLVEVKCAPASSDGSAENKSSGRSFLRMLTSTVSGTFNNGCMPTSFRSQATRS